MYFHHQISILCCLSFEASYGTCPTVHSWALLSNATGPNPGNSGGGMMMSMLGRELSLSSVSEETPSSGAQSHSDSSDKFKCSWACSWIEKKNYANFLPGHSLSLHGFVSSGCPGHSPPRLACWEMVLFLVWLPSPHDLLHGCQEFQLPHWHGTERLHIRRL